MCLQEQWLNYCVKVLNYCVINSHPHGETTEMFLSTSVCTGTAPVPKMHHLLVPLARLQRNSALRTAYSRSSPSTKKRCLSTTEIPPAPSLESVWRERISNHSGHRTDKTSLLTVWPSRSSPIMVWPHHPSMPLEQHHLPRQLPSSSGSAPSESLHINFLGQLEGPWGCLSLFLKPKGQRGDITVLWATRDPAWKPGFFHLSNN